MKRYRILRLILLFLCLMFPAGRPAVFASAPSRIIAVGAPAVEMVCALGLERSLVARASWDTFPPSVLGLPDIGTPFAPDLELLLSLRPDIILLDDRLGGLAGKLSAFGLTAMPVQAYNPSEVIPAVKKLASALGCERRGEELAADLQDLSASLQKRLAAVPPEKRMKGVMLTGISELFGVAPQSGCSLMEDGGAVNLAEGLGQAYPLLSLEWLAGQGPDFVLVPEKSGAPEREKKREAARARLAGVLPEQSRIIFMDENLTYGLRSYLGALQLASELYPSLFADEEAERMQELFMRKYFPAACEAGEGRP